MKKVIKITNIDCANCAAKIEREIGKLDGVKSAGLSFMSERLVLEYDDEKEVAVFEGIKKIAKKIEPDCKIIGM